MRLLLGKIYELAWIQGLTCIVVVCFVSCCIGGLDLLGKYTHFLLEVSGVFVLGYKKGKNRRKVEVVYLIFAKT